MKRHVLAAGHGDPAMEHGAVLCEFFCNRTAGVAAAGYHAPAGGTKNTNQATLSSHANAGGVRWPPGRSWRGIHRNGRESMCLSVEAAPHSALQPFCYTRE